MKPTHYATIPHEPIIFDTTLREGMQTPGGIGGTLEERVFAANHIARFADWVELGMPANDVEYRIIDAIRQSFQENNREAGIAVLCLNRKADIDKASEVIGGYHSSLAHLFIGTSEEHTTTRFDGRWSKEDYAENIRTMVAYASAKPFTRVMFSPEDSYRTFAQSRRNFFAFVDAAIAGYEEGNPARTERLILNFPDTVGKSAISEFDLMLGRIRRRYGDAIEVSVHCHNDSDSSTQQAIEALAKGKATWLQTTFGGLGERNGIAPTEGVIAMLHTRGYLNGKRYGTQEVLKDLVPTTHAILAALGRSVPAEAIISGSRVNTTTSGIHANLVMKRTDAYHIHGDTYGPGITIEFGPTSGSTQVIPILAKLGIERQKADIERFTNRLKRKCNEEKTVLDETSVMYEAAHEFKGIIDPLVVDDYAITTRKGQKSGVELAGSYRGGRFDVRFEDNGPVEALLGALRGIVGIPIELTSHELPVIQKIPEEYLSWKAGEYPRIPHILDMHAKLQATTTITDGERQYTSSARREDSFQAIADSVIQAAVKMMTLKEAGV